MNPQNISREEIENFIAYVEENHPSEYLEFLEEFSELLDVINTGLYEQIAMDSTSQ